MATTPAPGSPAATAASTVTPPGRAGSLGRTALCAALGLGLAGACSGGAAGPAPSGTGTPSPRTVAPAPSVSAGTIPSATPPATRPSRAVPVPGEVGRMGKGPGGLPPVVTAIPTKRKVVFLTIDDGWEQDPGFAELVRKRAVPITVFATRDAVEARGAPDPTAAGGRYVGAGKWSYFRGLRDLGVPIENHTLTHPGLRGLGHRAQRAEICGAGQVIARQIGTRPTLFRPPFGAYDTTTLRAVRACGMSAVLLWTASVQPGGKIAYQTPDKRLHPGDILLLHFRPHLARDFRVLLNKIERRGFLLGDLHAYLRAAGIRRAHSPAGVAADHSRG